MTVRGIRPGIMHFISMACIGHSGTFKEPVAFNTVVTSSGECVCVVVGVFGFKSMKS